MTLGKSVVLGLLLAGVGGISGANAQNANNGNKRIVILGDSITAGYGLDPQEAYPALLQGKINAAALPYTVAAAGVSGDTTASGLRRVKWALGQQGAAVLIIALGGNDGLRGIPTEEMAANLSGIIDQARVHTPTIKVILAGMEMPSNLGTEFTVNFKAVFAKVASDKKIALIPFLIDGVGGDAKLNQPDQIHPTAEGQKQIAETVWKLLEPQLVR